MSRARAFASRLLLMLAGTALALVVAEAALRSFTTVPLVATDLFLVTEPASSPEALARARRALMPGTLRRHVTAEYDVPVHISRQGLRDTERRYERAPGVRRLLVLGDSFTFGYGVELRERFTNRLETALNTAAVVLTSRADGQGLESGSGKGLPSDVVDPGSATGSRTPMVAPSTSAVRYEVINAGTPSWGTVDELLFFREEGGRYRPDMVLVCFYENDLLDNQDRGHLAGAGDRSPADRPGEPGHIGEDTSNERLGTTGGSRSGGTGEKETGPRSAGSSGFHARVLALDPGLRRPEPGFWLEHSQLARFLRQSWLRARTASYRSRLDAARIDAAAQQRTIGFLTALRDASEAAGARFILMLMPDRRELEGPLQRTLEPWPRLLEWAGHEGPVLDLLPGLRAAAAGLEVGAKAGEAATLYYPRDSHLTVRGHLEVARLLQNFLRDSGVLSIEQGGGPR